MQLVFMAIGWAFGQIIGYWLGIVDPAWALYSIASVCGFCLALAAVRS